MRRNLILPYIIFLLVLAATATGIFDQTPGTPIPYTTLHGEQAVFQGSGLYRFKPAWLAGGLNL